MSASRQGHQIAKQQQPVDLRLSVQSPTRLCPYRLNGVVAAFPLTQGVAADAGELSDSADRHSDICRVRHVSRSSLKEADGRASALARQFRQLPTASQPGLRKNLDGRMVAPEPGRGEVGRPP